MFPLNKPLLIYDGECAFCIKWIKYWRNLIGNKIDYAPWQRAAPHFPNIPIAKFNKSVVLIKPDGKSVTGARAVFESLAYGGRRHWLWLYKNIFGLAWLSELVYCSVSKNRSFFYHLTIFFTNLFHNLLLLIIVILSVMALLTVF